MGLHPRRETPIRRQYLEIKRRYPEALLLFQMGDFYEAFDEDAEVLARELGIALTTKVMGKNFRVPLAGIPCHSLEQHLRRLIERGHKVAICDQLSPPGKGLVKRDVVRVITPGTVIEPSLLEGKANNYLASLMLSGSSPSEPAGLAYVDISTGEFATTQTSTEQALLELERLKPAEVLLPREQQGVEFPFPTSVTYLADELFEQEATHRTLLEQLEVSTLAAFGCEGLPLAIRAAGAILHYLRQTQPMALTQLTQLTTYFPEAFMALDPQTLHNLAVFPPYSGSSFSGAPGSEPSEGKGSLLEVIDLTQTPMGGRLLKKWLRQPSLDLKEIHRRQEVVQWFYEHAVIRSRFQAQLDRVCDLERLIHRIRNGVATPREVVMLGRSLEVLPSIIELLQEGKEVLASLWDSLRPCKEVVDLVSRALVDNPPAVPATARTSWEQGGVIREGFSQELDQLRSLLRSSKKYLADLESRERERTGIKSLKVGYNKVFGYYIEVTKPNLHLVPPDYIRKQTLVGAERFFTPELKEYEALISNAEARILELEASLFRQVCSQIGQHQEAILTNARTLAQLDVLAGWAEVALRRGYVRPELHSGTSITIRRGRHPVVEQSLALRKAFVPNDTELSTEGTQIMVLTGPNMAGKSTYLRQVALIVLLAQVGSFVPAESASIGLVDRIFTRVGLQDRIVAGQSSFLVEMTEIAHILNNATPRSLVILDEIGRGTGTYDGLAIARAVVEYLHNHPKHQAQTLFATHYHELTDLEGAFPRVRNFHMPVREEKGRIVFLHRVLPGKSLRSYGVQVARMAGLPRPVIQRAREIVARYEAGEKAAGKTPTPHVQEARNSYGPSIPENQALQKILRTLLELDIHTLTPIEALSKLYELQQTLQRLKDM